MKLFACYLYHYLGICIVAWIALEKGLLARAGTRIATRNRNPGCEIQKSLFVMKTLFSDYFFFHALESSRSPAQRSLNGKYCNRSRLCSTALTLVAMSNEASSCPQL